MGCLTSPKVTDPAEQIRLLSGLRNNVLTTIETNKVKISRAEKEIQEIDDNMKQIENDLRQNQYSYSETEKLQKAQKVLELKTDYQRAQKSLDLLKANKTNFENSLQMIESKINEIKNNEILKKQDDIIDKIGNTDPTPILRKNY
jgi:chromosome segregation ATPase